MSRFGVSNARRCARPGEVIASMGGVKRKTATVALSSAADCRSLIVLLPSFIERDNTPWLNRRMFKPIGRELACLRGSTDEHLHSGGFATTRDQAKRVSITDESRVLDVGCGIGGPARYLA